MARTRIKKNLSYDKDRKLYYACLQWGKDENGKYLKTYYTDSNKKKAEEALRNHERDRAAGKLVLPTKLSLVEAAENYLSYKRLDLEETTMYGYRNILNNHIKPHFGDKPIQNVTLQDIQDYEIAKAERLSASTVKKHRELLKSVFLDACRKQIISKNPMELMERQRRMKKKRTCMNADEIALLIESVKGLNLEVPVVLAAMLGLRRGEVLGLRWSDIDFEKRVLHVCNSRTKAGGNIIEKAPKTEKSNRSFIMPEEVVNALRKARAAQEKLAGINRNYVNSGYVVTKKDGKPFAPNYLSEAFHAHIQKMGMQPIRFHDLRHSFASIANEAGTSMMEISSAMGHSNLGVTSSVYTHEFSETKSVAVNAVAQEIAKFGGVMHS